MKPFGLLLLLLGFLLHLGAQPFNSSNLPILVIETNGTDIVDEPKVMVEMGLIYNGPGQRNLLTDPFNEYAGWAGIEYRGSTSQQLYDKKSYALETREQTGDNRNVSLLGMPEENDWVLHGPYGDKSLLRNALAYKLAGSIMEYAPRIRFIELVIDGGYEGLYLLTEKIKRDKNRVDISKLRPEDESGDQLTGGYILKFDKLTGASSESFLSNYPPEPNAWQQTAFLYHDPKGSELSDTQKDYIQQYLHDFEDLLQSPTYADSVTGYFQHIDVQSFADFFIINELCKNVDAYRLSTYFYKDRDSVDTRLKLGPVWDFNLGFGNVDFCLGAGVEGWVKDYNLICPDDNWLVPFWWRRFWADRRFRQAVQDRWQELRQNQLSDERLETCIDSLNQVIGEAQDRNFQRWSVLSQYVWPNWFVGDTHDEEVEYLINWLENRVAWIDGQMASVADPFYVLDDYFDPRAYPNPFAESLRFEYYARRIHDVEIRLYNAQGQLLLQQIDRDHPNGESELTLSTAQLPAGIYFYQVWINDEALGKGKLIKGF